MTGTSSTTSGDYVLINNGATNDLPNDLLFATPSYDPNGVCNCVEETDPVGVWYDTATEQWAVFDETLAEMPVGESFNILAVPVKRKSVFTATATSANTTGDYTIINSSQLNGKPTAQIQITQVFNPGGAGGTYNPHNVGVFYETSLKKWAIFNEDGANMPIGASFNVMTSPKASNGGTGILQTASSSNADGNGTIVDNSETNGNPNAVVFDMQVWNPDGKGGIYNNYQTGMDFDAAGDVWNICNEGATSAIPSGVAFNALIFSS